ncbi:MAG: hypothetical protein H0T13_00695 [Actinobacteria bacterium]|nr:hypothetical protein [Actinomycetota bacterium]
MTDSLPLLETEIRSLLDNPPARSRTARELVEHTLTDGYAHALALDGHRLRVERRLRDLVRSAAAAGAQVADVSRELAEIDTELARLRALLSTLRAHAL